MAERDPFTEGGERRPCRCEGVGVLVEPHHPEVRVSGEQGEGVAPATHGGIDHDARWHRCEQLDHSLDHDGPVQEGVASQVLAHGAPGDRVRATSLTGSPPVGRCRRDFSPIVRDGSGRSRGIPSCRPGDCG